MKRINQPIIALVAVGMFSAPALAGFTVDHSNYPIYSDGNGVTITATPIGEGYGGVAGPFAPIYDSIPGFAGSFTGAGPGGFLFDDYTSTAAPGTYGLTKVMFVGGVDVASVLFFDFFDTGGSFIDGFGVGLGPGLFVYTITAGGNPFVLADEAGSMMMTPDPLATLTWFFSPGAAIGSNIGVPGSETGSDLDTIYSFALFIPSPGALALLGVAGLLGAPRRRRT